MNKTDFVHIGYSFLEETMRRVITMPAGFSFIMFEDKHYSLAKLVASEQVHSLSRSSAIIKDEDGQYWYHRVFGNEGMEMFETYEPLPEEVVSDEYEQKRIRGMMIFPFIRHDHTRGLIEVYENCPHRRDEEIVKRRILKLNGKEN